MTFRLLGIKATIHAAVHSSSSTNSCLQPDEQCDTMSHSERVILAARFSGELPATDSLVYRTVPRISVLAQADYTIPVAAQPSLPFSEALIYHFQKMQQELKPSCGQIIPICFGTLLQRVPALSVTTFFYRFSFFTGLTCRR